MICIGFIVLLVAMFLFNHFCHYGRNDFWDKVYDITDWAIIGVGFITGFEILFSLVFLVSYNTSLNIIDNIYEDIYALEPHLSETRVVFITQSKITEYEREINANIIFGRLTGFDTSKFEAFPTLSISNNGTIVES